MNGDKGSIEILGSDEMAHLARQVYERLKGDERFSYSQVEYTTFANGEIKPKIPQTIRHKDVYLFHSLYHPDPNTSYMKLLFTMDAVARASADSITLVLPYMSYLRQDRKDEPRVPISAKVMADLVQTNPRLERIMTMDMHCDQEQGFYRVPVDNLYGSLVHGEYFREKYGGNFENLVVVSPDHGGAVRARRFAKSLDESVPVYLIDKRRTGPNRAEALHFIGGDIEGKDVVIYDDMIDTGGSIVAASKMAYERGASHVYAVATHGIFSAGAERRFADAGIEAIVTQTIPRDDAYYERNKEWLTALPIDDLIARAVDESSRAGGSVSRLFER
ncbi:MAG: ribose-phosphate diphosphokinase [Nanoarchaeota archaeon]